MSRRNRLLIFLCLFALTISLCSYLKLFNNITQIPTIIADPKPPYRGCIVSLIRSDNLVSLNKVLNMLNSLYIYFQNIQRYPIYLFHEPTLTNETKEHILFCSSKLNIQFYEISFDIPFPSNRSGYASMCQFWSYDLWFKYQILQNHCDYVMRFDDDSYLINSTERDLFEEFHQNQFDYAYRIIYHDNNGLEFLRDNLRTFLAVNETRRGCIQSLCTPLNGPHGYDGLAVYNNFFVLRLNLIYENPIIERYLKQLVSSHAFYQYRIGDANVQAISLFLIEKPIKIAYMKFPYNHNVHGAAELFPSFIYYGDSAFMWHFQMRMPNVTCHRIFIVTKYSVIEKIVEQR